jgi:hypothetical protein
MGFDRPIRSLFVGLMEERWLDVRVVEFLAVTEKACKWAFWGVGCRVWDVGQEAETRLRWERKLLRQETESVVG